MKQFTIKHLIAATFSCACLLGLMKWFYTLAPAFCRKLYSQYLAAMIFQMTTDQGAESALAFSFAFATYCALFFGITVLNVKFWRWANRNSRSS